jgi:L-threonylcarbamoyladenylate synthase
MKVISEKDLDAVSIACEFLRAGKVISFATDTIYGIAVDASNFKAVEALYKIKKRDEKKPIAIFVKDLKAAKKIFYFDNLAKKISEKYFPGALTLVLKTKIKSASILAKNLNYNADGFLGFRIVDSNFIEKLLEKFDGALAVTSANLSGQKAATSATEIVKNLTKLDLLISGKVSKKTPSTVLKISNKKITILRQGALKIDL